MCVCVCVRPDAGKSVLGLDAGGVFHSVNRPFLFPWQVCSNIWLVAGETGMTSVYVQEQLSLREKKETYQRKR